MSGSTAQICICQWVWLSLSWLVPCLVAAARLFPCLWLHRLVLLPVLGFWSLVGSLGFLSPVCAEFVVESDLSLFRSSSAAMGCRRISVFAFFGGSLLASLLNLVTTPPPHRTPPTTHHPPPHPTPPHPTPLHSIPTPSPTATTSNNTTTTTWLAGLLVPMISRCVHFVVGRPVESSQVQSLRQFHPCSGIDKDTSITPGPHHHHHHHNLHDQPFHSEVPLLG